MPKMEWDEESDRPGIELPEHQTLKTRAPEKGLIHEDPGSAVPKEEKKRATPGPTSPEKPTEPATTFESKDSLPPSPSGTSFMAEALENVDDRSFFRILQTQLPKEDVKYLQAESYAAGLPVEALIEAKRLLPPETLLQLTSDFFNIPVAPTLKPDRDVLKKDVLRFMTNNILPLSPTEFVIAAPRNATIFAQQLSQIGLFRPKFFLARKGTISKALMSAIMSIRETPKALQDQIDKSIQSGKGAAAVTNIVSYAYRLYASDLHFERQSSHGRLRARIHGIMEEICPLTPTQYERLVVAIYQMIGSTQPSLQESGGGAFDVAGIPVQVRVSLMPSLYGHHNVVMRLLPKDSDVPSGEDLGYTTEKWERILRAVKKSASGLVLMVGPTGSGKNSTLFSILSSLDTRGKKLIEVADPIEYKHMFGIQTQLSDSGKVTWNYPDALRESLRHDPDMIYVGEIRDEKSAKIALDAARTGHLIFSTVHAETVFEAFDRLVDLGCPISYLLASVNLVIAQRLVRKICQNCEGAGCHSCGGGYVGRTAVAEVLEMSEAIREEFNGSLPPTQRARYDIVSHIDRDFKTLREEAILAVQNKTTSWEELLRVFGIEDMRGENVF